VSHSRESLRPQPAAMTYRDELSDVRDFVRQQAVRAGLPDSRATDLVIAASEVAANTLQHTDGDGEVRVWAQPGEVICEFRDTGTIADPHVGLTRPPDEVSGGLGLWVARQVCDAVNIETGAAGTTVRLRMNLGGGGGQTLTERSQVSLAMIASPREIDSANVGWLRESLTSAVRDHSVVVVDLSASTFCDSSGIRAFVIAMQDARGTGCDLRIVMGGPAVRRAFKLTGVDQVLRIFDTLDEATAGLPPASARTGT
jgi:anti-anti-sigma factor